MKRFWFRRAFRFLGFAILFAGLVGYTVMTLWNALLPEILGVKFISFWQALGLLVLSRILFGGFRGGGWRRGGFGSDERGFGNQQGFGRQAWKEKMAEHWKTMTPEKREKMKQKWRGRCGGWGHNPWEEPKSDEPGQADSNVGGSPHSNG